MAHYEKTGNKGHGCCGGIFTLLLVLVAIVALLFYTTDVLGDIEKKVMMQFYPIEYAEYVEYYSEYYSVREPLVYAVIRTESGFRAEVESSVGAVGLMQIMPDTFDWLQSLEGDSQVYPSDALKSPEVNIKYGTYYLSILLDHYNGVEQLAVAAYNGGISNVDSWLEDERYSSDGVTLSDIPFVETSQYVERVENTKAMYESLYYDNN